MSVAYVSSWFHKGNYEKVHMVQIYHTLGVCMFACFWEGKSMCVHVNRKEEQKKNH